MRIVRIWGGLGNQMYQYAFGKGLENHTGESILYDVNVLAKKCQSNSSIGDNGIPSRFLELTHFPNIKLKLASYGQIDQSLGGSNNILSKAKRALNRWFRLKISVPDERDFWITDALEGRALEDEDKWPLAGLKSYYAGYWQHISYFAEVEDDLRRDFQFPEMDDEFNRRISKQIATCSCPVCLHVRRGDYLNANWEISSNYYQKAVEYITSHVNNPTFFIFGQNCDEFIGNELHINSPAVIVGNENTRLNQDFRDMQLMSLCRHHIIANSSFSWWAAWLAKWNGQIVVYPSPWIEGKDHDCPQSWKKIVWV